MENSNLKIDRNKRFFYIFYINAFDKQLDYDTSGDAYFNEKEKMFNRDPEYYFAELSNNKRPIFAKVWEAYYLEEGSGHFEEAYSGKDNPGHYDLEGLKTELRKLTKKYPREMEVKVYSFFTLAINHPEKPVIDLWNKSISD